MFKNKNMIKTIGIIGFGTMGSQIAVALKSKNVDVIVKIKSLDKVEKYKEIIKSYCENIFWKRYFGKDFNIENISNLTFTTNINDFKDCELIIESVSENYETKYHVIDELNQLDKPDLIVTSNTSGLLMSKLAKRYNYPENFHGLHFFNPFPISKLIEITNPSGKNLMKLIEVTKLLSKQQITITEKSGLFINRLISPFWIDAINEFQNTNLTAYEIDNAIKLGLAHSMDPLETVDRIGLDILLDYCFNVYKETTESKFKPPQILIDKVTRGHLGLKTNKGFYLWNEKNKIEHDC